MHIQKVLKNISLYVLKGFYLENLRITLIRSNMKHIPSQQKYIKRTFVLWLKNKKILLPIIFK